MEKGHGALCAILGLDASQSEEKYRITELQDFGRSWEILGEVGEISGKVGRFREKLGEVGRWVPNALVLADTLHGYEIKKREKRHRNEVKRNKHGEDLNIDRFRGFGPEFEGRDLEVDEFDSPS
ncbi:hypothetical protein B0H14DRAFT_2616979 [Mycena olivaceomarginata]|nr:hypothetical protein B0H14DRAFT_2616979 [Mycena olivaceomarginata]